MRNCIAIFFAGFLISNFYSCAVEEDIQHVDKKSSAITSRIISFDEFKKINTKSGLATHGLEKFGNAARPTRSENYDFTVDTETILLIQKDSYTAFALPIQKENEGSSFENLFLHPYMDGYLAYRVRYEFSPEDLEKLNSGIPVDNLFDKATFEILENPDINDIGINYATTARGGGFTGLLYWYDGQCWRFDEVRDTHFTIVVCGDCGCVDPSTVSPPTPAAGSGPGYSHALYLSLVDLGNGNPGIPIIGPGGGSGGTGGAPYNPFNPPPSPTNPPRQNGPNFPNPVLGVVSPALDKLPSKNCQDLQKKSQDGVWRAKMNELKGDAQNSTAEAGMATYSGNPKYGPKTYGGLDSNGNSYVSITPDPARANEATGFMHCHLNAVWANCLAVFSLSDFVGFKRLVLQSTQDVSSLTMYVTSNKGTFAVKINNLQALVNFSNQIESSAAVAQASRNPQDDKVLKDFERKVKPSQSTEKQTKELLNFLNQYNANDIELYHADENFNNWKQMYIDGDKKLKSKNC